MGVVSANALLRCSLMLGVRPVGSVMRRVVFVMGVRFQSVVGVRRVTSSMIQHVTRNMGEVSSYSMSSSPNTTSTTASSTKARMTRRDN